MGIDIMTKFVKMVLLKHCLALCLQSFRAMFSALSELRNLGGKISGSLKYNHGKISPQEYVQMGFFKEPKGIKCLVYMFV